VLRPLSCQLIGAFVQMYTSSATSDVWQDGATTLSNRTDVGLKALPQVFEAIPWAPCGCRLREIGSHFSFSACTQCRTQSPRFCFAHDHREAGNVQFRRTKMSLRQSLKSLRLFSFLVWASGHQSRSIPVPETTLRLTRLVLRSPEEPKTVGLHAMDNSAVDPDR